MDPTGPTYAPDYLKNPRPIDWLNPNEDDIASNMMTWKDFQPSEKEKPGASQCAAPQQLKDSEIFARATDIADKMGGDSQCIKETDNQSGTRSKSSSDDSRQELNADFQAQGKAPFVSASVNASMNAKNSTTKTDQDSGSHNNAKSRASGCGSTMITANNVVQKQLAMQCVINNVSQDTQSFAKNTASITIQTLPLTPEEVAAQAALTIAQNKIILNNNNNLNTITMTLASKAKTDGTPFYPMSDIINLVNSLRQVYEKQQELMNQALKIYDRSVNITKSKITNKADTSVKVFTELSTSAKSDLATLSASVQKDLTAQSIANTMGVSAQDPNVKTMASKACESTSSSSSSSITNILNKLSVSASTDGKIVIIVAGTINITDSEITNTTTLKLATQAVMNQAISNSQSSAAQFMSDSSNTQGVENKVAGLEDLQKALGTTISDAITANQAAVINSQNVDAQKSAAYYDKVKAVFTASSTTDMIIAIVVGLIIIYYFFSGSSTPPSSGGGNRFRSFRFNRL